jgi:hypothetical protein
VTAAQKLNRKAILEKHQKEVDVFLYLFLTADDRKSMSEQDESSLEFGLDFDSLLNLLSNL